MKLFDAASLRSSRWVKEVPGGDARNLLDGPSRWVRSSIARIRPANTPPIELLRHILRTSSSCVRCAVVRLLFLRSFMARE